MTRPPGSHPGPRPAHALLVSLPPFRFAALFPVCACAIVLSRDAAEAVSPGLSAGPDGRVERGLRPLKPTTASPGGFFLSFFIEYFNNNRFNFFTDLTFSRANGLA